MKNQFSCLDI